MKRVNKHSLTPFGHGCRFPQGSIDYQTCNGQRMALNGLDARQVHRHLQLHCFRCLARCATRREGGFPFSGRKREPMCSKKPSKQHPHPELHMGRGFVKKQHFSSQLEKPVLRVSLTTQPKLYHKSRFGEASWAGVCWGKKDRANGEIFKPKPRSQEAARGPKTAKRKPSKNQEFIIPEWLGRGGQYVVERVLSGSLTTSKIIIIISTLNIITGLFKVW
jgi:hypothetical protein